MNCYNLISKLKKYPKQSFPGGVDDPKYNVIAQEPDDGSVNTAPFPAAGTPSDTITGDTGDSRIPTTQTPADSKSSNTISVKNYIKNIKNTQVKDQNKKINISKQKNIPPSIIEPSPTPAEQKIIREYNSKGIYFKSNLNAINKRDNFGNITLIIKDTNG